MLADTALKDMFLISAFRISGFQNKAVHAEFLMAAL